MTTIDHRILIPSPPQTVWEYISNVENFTEWQVDCNAVSFLSQKRRGVGLRWRQRSKNRTEVVYEVSTWYDGLGFEYVHVDGASYKSAQGRIRLQEIAEGTIVQWTFTYEVKGMLGELVNTLSTQRRHESQMAESLKTLWKVAKRSGSLEGYQSRALMRDGLQDPIARAQYHSQVAPTSTEEPKPTLANTLSAQEPATQPDDTRPRVVTPVPTPSITSDMADVAPSTTTPAPERTPNTDEISRFAPPPSVSKLSEAPSTPEPQPALKDEPAKPLTPPQPLSVAMPEPPAEQDDDVPFRLPHVDNVPEPPAASLERTPTAKPAAISVASTPPEEDFNPRIPSDKDSSQLSIWEIFGVPSPTDTQRMRAIQIAEEAEAEYQAEHISPASQSAAPTPTPSTSDTPPQNGRVGLRGQLRRELVKLRRPS